MRKNLEEMVVGLHERGFIGYAKTPDDYITLKSGRKSPHYVNFRGVMSFDKDHDVPMNRQNKIRDMIINECAEVIDGMAVDFDHLGPIPQAVTQLGGAVAQKAGVSCVNVRVPESDKSYGKHKPIEGDYKEGEIVLGFDDVITTWQAKSEFLVPIGLANLVLKDFLVIVDREEGGRINAEQAGYGLHSVVGMNDVNQILHQNKLINDQEFQSVVDYLAEYGDK